MTLTRNQLVTIRDYRPEDKNFIYATWLRGLHYGESWFSIIDKDVFMKNYQFVLDALLAKPTTTIKVACDPDDQDIIRGYAVYHDDVLHWTFVKKAWRGIGIAKQLVPSTITTVTHLTKVGLSILHKKNLQFNPFIL